MNNYFIKWVIFVFGTLLYIPQIYGEESNVIEIVIFKVKDPTKGVEIARSIIKDAKSFNNGVIKDEVYQSVNDPCIIAQRITWQSLEKAKEAFAASETFPSAPNFFDQSECIIIFDHFKQINEE